MWFALCNCTNIMHFRFLTYDWLANLGAEMEPRPATNVCIERSLRYCRLGAHFHRL